MPEVTNQNPKIYHVSDFKLQKYTALVRILFAPREAHYTLDIAKLS